MVRVTDDRREEDMPVKMELQSVRIEDGDDEGQTDDESCDGQAFC